MKKIIFLCLITSLCFSDENNKNILRDLKKENLKLKKEGVQNSSDVLEKSWINPLAATLSKQKSQITSKRGERDEFAAQISLNQDIFRSGGIFYAIKYADATRALGLSQIQSEENALVLQAYSLLVQLLRNDVLQKQQRLAIKNSELDIHRKKEQYVAGVVDISFLNDAIVAKIAKQNTLLSLEDAKDSLLIEFEKLSDKEYKSIKVPKVKIPTKEEYLAQNLSLLMQKNNIESKKQFSNITKSKYLPRVFVKANYTLSKSTTREVQDFKDDHYGYGIGVSIPLDIKMNNDIESKRVEYLIAQNELEIFKQDELKEYEKITKDLRRLEKKIALADENIKIYDSLLSQTKELVEAGMQIKNDQSIMENSKNIRILEAKSYELEKELKKLEFYRHIPYM